MLTHYVMNINININKYSTTQWLLTLMFPCRLIPRCNALFSPSKMRPNVVGFVQQFNKIHRQMLVSTERQTAHFSAQTLHSSQPSNIRIFPHNNDNSAENTNLSSHNTLRLVSLDNFLHTQNSPSYV